MYVLSFEVFDMLTVWLIFYMGKNRIFVFLPIFVYKSALVAGCDVRKSCNYIYKFIFSLIDSIFNAQFILHYFIILLPQIGYLWRVFMAHNHNPATHCIPLSKACNLIVLESCILTLIFRLL